MKHPFFRPVLQSLGVSMVGHTQSVVLAPELPLLFWHSAPRLPRSTTIVLADA
jgi:hypothetical protein